MNTPFVDTSQETNSTSADKEPDTRGDHCHGYNNSRQGALTGARAVKPRPPPPQRAANRSVKLPAQPGSRSLEKQGSLFLWIGSLTGFERVTILSSTKLSYCSCPMVRML
ncbi:hypothetical protein ACOMHN_011015 [Nucella lapillus]